MRFHTDAWMTALIRPSVVFLMPLLWLVGIYILAQYMTKRERPFQVNRAVRIYNIVQIVLCSYMVWGLSPVVGFPNVFGINSAFDARGEWFVFVHYLSKFLDWFDTLWILLKKNRDQFSFLHVYHHATISMIWGLLLRKNVGMGTARFGAWLNSVTHVIMYAHYLWTSFGLKNPCKRYVTRIQIGQFWSCIAHVAVAYVFETTPVRRFIWLQCAYHTAMIYFFTCKLAWVPPCAPQGKSE